MPGLDRLPAGPHRDLVEALHQLYRGAGMPGLRPIVRAVMDGDYRDTVSHEKVAVMLRGEGLPRWSKLEPVVRVLASWHTPRLDVDAETARIQRLWYVARGDEPAPDPIRHAAGVPYAGTESPDPAGHSDDTEDLVRRVGAEVAARARAERRADSDRGYRDGVKFAGELPSWRLLEELASVDFAVATWITSKKEVWGRVAAGLDPYSTQLPDWAATAAGYLGTLADPISYDQFSFTPTDAYLDGFGAGLRAVWDAARPAQSAPASPGVPAAAEADLEAASHRLADNLHRLLRGHGGLSLDDVERAGQTLLERLRDRFEHATVRDRLPPDATLMVDWFQPPGCDYGNRSYRLINWHYQGLKVVATIGKPEPVRAECTPIPGISRARDAEHGLIAIDANRPSARPLLLSIADIHPQVSPGAAAVIDDWVEQCLTALLTEFSEALTGALARRGYDS
jgi:hypothetical protein